MSELPKCKHGIISKMCTLCEKEAELTRLAALVASAKRILRQLYGNMPVGVEVGVDQCDAAVVPVFVKQMDLGKRVSHDPAEWPEWARRQEWHGEPKR